MRRSLMIGVVPCAGLLAAQAASAQSVFQTASDPYRPDFHFTAPTSWLNDPNGLLYVNGQYNMYYQYTPGTIAATAVKDWGHAVSTDMVHWTYEPVAIATDGVTEIWSGSAVVDSNNTAGFGAGAVVAVYAGAQLSNTNVESQNIAYSLDNGMTFTKYPGNPVIPAGAVPFRDPSVSWYAPGSSWVMAVSQPGINGATRPAGIQIYTSSNLKTWTYQSVSSPNGAECPDLFQMQINGDPNNTAWVEMDGVNGGTSYSIGTFNGTIFTPQTAIVADYGDAYYAAQQWAGVPQAIARHTAIAWMANPGTAANTPSTAWRGEMTIPRDLNLMYVNGRYAILQTPAPELQSLRTAIPFIAAGGGVISSTSDPLAGSAIDGDQLEIVATIAPGTAADFGVMVRKGSGQYTRVGYNVSNHAMFEDRTTSGNTLIGPAFSYAPMSLMANGDIQLDIFIDSSSVEVFGNNGQATITNLIFPNISSNGVSLFADGGTAQLVSLEAYQMGSSIGVTPSGVPEPAWCIAMVSIAGVGLLSRRRRSR